MSDETDDNADFLAAELAKAQAEIDALRRERDEAVARAEKAEKEVKRLRAALEEIRDQRCDCDCPLDGGQHFHDCVTGSVAVDIARTALKGKW